MSLPIMHHLQRRVCLALFLVSLVGGLAGCVGSPVHETLKYNRTQNAIERNNKNLLRLRVGMAQAEIRTIMGDPERSEGYSWGTAWLSRTAMTSGVYGTADSDFTPVMLDQNGALIGWGRNFSIEQAKKYELKIKKEE